MRKFIAAVLLLIASRGFATDAELTNYKTGIDCVWGGTKGTAYQEEYFFSDKTISDRKVVYIRDTTSITMSHNARNVAFINTFNIPGGTWVGTFLAGETATQAGTGATTVITVNQSSGSTLVGYSISGDPSQLGKYTGNTSHAEFTPTNGGTAWVFGIVGASDAYATTRYRVDRDFQFPYGEYSVGTDGSGTLLPAYSTPLTFATLTYDGSTPVVGTTGATGGAFTIANADNYYWRGVIDPFGDEWHSITVGDDDHTNPNISGNFELYASDGKVILFVVNPKTSCLTVRSIGDAQFFTTAPKAYFTPRVVGQTTYFNAGTGSVTFELHDIMGTNTFYRINGGAWSAGAATVNLSDSDFSTGTNTLDYYNAGFGSTSVYKRRTVVKNPAFPSAVETHGSLFLQAPKTWATVLATIANTGTKVYAWYDYSNTNAGGSNFYNARGYVDAHYLKGERYGYSTDAYSYHANSSLNCIAAKIEGWTATPPGGTHNYLWYAKTQLLDNVTAIDPVGVEKNQAGTAGDGSYHACLGSRENIFRGYHDIKPNADILLNYDIMAATGRSDQVSGGMTAIEDYYIRECIARMIYTQMISALAAPGVYPNSGMWGTARNCLALAACYVIPTYNSSVFGVCGLDGSTTSQVLCPFPDVALTWKQQFIDTNTTLGTWPNYFAHVGVEQYVFLSDGNMGNGFKASYFNFVEMGSALAVGVNMAKINTPSLLWPNYDLYLVNAAAGTLHSVSQPEGNFQYTLPTNYNYRFPLSASAGVAWTATQTSGPESADTTMPSSASFGLIWWDDPLPFGGSVMGGSLTLRGTINTN